MSKYLIPLASILLFTICAAGQVFKAPKDVFPLPGKDTGFDHGMLMIRQKQPAGVFIEYPKENESLDQLRQRLADYIFPMFMHSKGQIKISPTITTIPTHVGDVADSGRMFYYAGEKVEVQMLFYERQAKGKTYLYGYFGQRSQDSKEPRDWADDKGNGVKFFDEFWETITP